MQIHPIPCDLGIAFLIESSRGLFLVDSGSPRQEERVIEKMHELGRRDLKLIWITHAHYDHYGSAAALRKLTGARIGVHPHDANFMEKGVSPLGSYRGRGFIYPTLQKVIQHFHPLPLTPPDFTLCDGDSLIRFGLNASILHTPGHTPGHSCLQLANGITFTGDLFGSFPKFGLQSVLATDWEQLPGSLLKLRSAQPDWIYAGHSGKPLSGKILLRINS